MKMKQAIRCVLEFLETRDDLSEEVCTAKMKIQELLNGFPGKIWDNENIRKAIERFIKENGRTPTTKELDTIEYLPTHMSIYQQYKKTAGEWLKENYPESSDYSRYYKRFSLSEEQAIELFKENFEKVNPNSAVLFNKLRDKKTPTWQFYAKILKVNTWSELKRKCGVRYSKEGKKFSVKSHLGYEIKK